MRDWVLFFINGPNTEQLDSAIKCITPAQQQAAKVEEMLINQKKSVERGFIVQDIGFTVL